MNATLGLPTASQFINFESIYQKGVVLASNALKVQMKKVYIYNILLRYWNKTGTKTYLKIFGLESNPTKYIIFLLTSRYFK